MIQNGENEPAGVTRRRMKIRREVNFTRYVHFFNP